MYNDIYLFCYSNLRLASSRFSMFIYREIELLFLNWWSYSSLSFWNSSLSLYSSYFPDFLLSCSINSAWVLFNCLDTFLACLYKFATLSSIFFLSYSMFLRYCFSFIKASYATSLDMDENLDSEILDYF